MTDRRGFTLLELLIALTLCAVLSGTALLGYRRMLSGWRLNAAARQVVVMANVTAVNAKEGYVTLRGPKGNSVDLAVPDPNQLKRVKVGDQVIYGKYSGTPYTLDGEEYVIIKSSDVLAKLG